MQQQQPIPVLFGNRTQMTNRMPVPPAYNRSFETTPIPTENVKSKSWCAQPLCLGLTRFSGGILFGTMIFLAIASTAGLIVSIVLYLSDINTDPQWKILGMVVCGIMLLTVLVTLCIFIYCHKKGHIINRKNPLDPPDHSHLPYGRAENLSMNSPNHDDVVQVQDKLTNTVTTISPLRPRDIQRGVWQGQNAYNGVSARPTNPPKMVHRVIEAQPNDIDRQQGNGKDRPSTHTIIHIPTNHHRKIEPDYELVEEKPRKPRRRRSPEEVIEIIPLPKQKNPRFKKVSVKHVRNNDDDFPIDHFYQ